MLRWWCCGDPTDLPVFEHATDTHGATLANFALFDLVGKQLSPRIRDLGKITLYRTRPRADVLDRYPRAGEGALRRRHHEQQTEQMSGHQRDRLLVYRVPRARRGHPAPDRPPGR
ncbi:hypothetical protein Ate01nite_35370 [Actinoplanes teichomyceticus]|nr:transposase [Actinoplanes teichomyceticus]GIF13505.1 hypothetical protein Ate01nite_35370 [Actinoplanes teichomyceticus]